MKEYSAPTANAAQVFWVEKRNMILEFILDNDILLSILLALNFQSRNCVQLGHYYFLLSNYLYVFCSLNS